MTAAKRKLARLRERVEGRGCGKRSGCAGSSERRTITPTAKGDDIDKAIAKLDGDRERLEARLTTLARENKRLKTDLAALEASKSENGNDARVASAALREQMNDLAAEVVNLTAKLDGPDSPIAKALGGTVGCAVRTDRSLADRVRALQKADSPNMSCQARQAFNAA